MVGFFTVKSQKFHTLGRSRYVLFFSSRYLGGDIEDIYVLQGVEFFKRPTQAGIKRQTCTLPETNIAMENPPF